MNFELLAERLRSYDSQEFGIGAEEAEINRVEKTLNLKISGSYREFLYRFGWGGIEHIEIFGLGVSVPKHLHLEKITKSERTEISPQLNRNLLPIYNDGAGNLYCLSCEIVNNDENPVVFWDHEGSHNQEAQLVANSFLEWLAGELDEIDATT